MSGSLCPHCGTPILEHGITHCLKAWAIELGNWEIGLESIEYLISKSPKRILVLENQKEGTLAGRCSASFGDSRTFEAITLYGALLTAWVYYKTLDAAEEEAALSSADEAEQKVHQQVHEIEDP